jgi:hypothetical protein
MQKKNHNFGKIYFLYAVNKQICSFFILSLPEPWLYLHKPLALQRFEMRYKNKLFIIFNLKKKGINQLK